MYQRFFIQFHLIGGEAADLTGEGFQGLLEEAVDGAHRKGPVVVQDVADQLSGPLFQLGGGIAPIRKFRIKGG